MTETETTSMEPEVEPTPEGETTNPTPEVEVETPTAEPANVRDTATKEKPETIAGLPILSVEDTPDLIKLFVYGDPGVGKTLLAASAAEVESMLPILFIDVEGGIKTFKRKFPGIKVTQPRNKYNAQGVMVKSAWKAFRELVEAGTLDTKYNTWIVDSVSELYSLAMEDTMRELKEDRPHRDEDVPDRREYNRVGSQVAKTLRALYKLPKHIICTAIKDSRTTAEGVVTAHTPAVAGKLAFRVASIPDELVYLYADTNDGEVTRKILSQPANKYIAKTRDDRLPQIVENPTMAKLAEYLL